jgi:signal transduction protein with GAF and PtsI domain
MPRPCTICSHEASWQIDLDLVRRVAYRTVAHHHGVSVDALKRHVKEHLPERLLRSQEVQDVADADLIKRELESEKADISRLKSKAEEDQDYRTALMACDKGLKALELQAKLAQLIAEGATVNLYSNPQWVEIRGVIVQALSPFPEARNAVLRGLEKVNGGGALR